MTRPGEPLDTLLRRAVLAVPTTESPGNDAKVFAAAIRVIARYGVPAVTMDHIATEAGISRATLFRRFGGKDDLLQLALTHEVKVFLDNVERALNSLPTIPERIAEALLACLRVSSHPLLSADGEASNRTGFGNALTTGDPSPLDLGRRFVADRIAAAQAAGDLPPGPAHLQADVLVRIALSYAVLPQGAIDLTDEPSLRSLVDTTLVPILMQPGKWPRPEGRDSGARVKGSDQFSTPK